jgi:putative transposase
MIRCSPAERREIIDLVEHSAMPVGRTLAELDVPRSRFYRWFQQCQQEGEQGLEPQLAKRRHFCHALAG